MNSQPEVKSDKEMLISQVQGLQAELEITNEHLEFLKSDRLKLNEQLALKEEEISKLSKLLADVIGNGDDSKGKKIFDESKIDKVEVLRPEQYVALLSLDKEVEADVMDSIATADEVWTDSIHTDNIDLSLPNSLATDGKLFSVIQNLGLMYSYEEHGKVLYEHEVRFNNKGNINRIEWSKKPNQASLMPSISFLDDDLVLMTGQK
jgi:hypothetical protein